jgi:hypothetical protein
MNSLPLRRETAFGTACLTGLAPMLLAEVFVFAVTAALYGGRGVTLTIASGERMALTKLR